MVERSKTIMMNDREALKKGGHTINDYRYVSIQSSPYIRICFESIGAECSGSVGRALDSGSKDC